MIGRRAGQRLGVAWDTGGGVEPIELRAFALQELAGEDPDEAAGDDRRPDRIGRSLPKWREGAGRLVIGERTHAIDAGHVDRAIGVCVAAKAAFASAFFLHAFADFLAVDGGCASAHRRLVDEVAQFVLAGLKQQAAGQELGAR